MTDRVVKVTLAASIGDYQAKMAQASAATSKFSTSTKANVAAAHGEVSRLGSMSASAASSVKGLVAAGVGLAIFAKGAQFLTDSVKAASDLQQVSLKSRVIFGASAAAMDTWGSTAADAFGLSKSAALTATATFGDMFAQIGFGQKDIAGMSQGVVELAADLGSFNNLDTATVLDMISASFRGEYDSLQRVIPNINAARVQTEAMTVTGKKSAAALTAQEKATATLAIIQHDGARASGDFARSAGTLAIEQQKLQAKTENLQATIGGALLPVLSAAAQLAQGGAEALTMLVEAVAALPEPVKAAALALVAFHLLRGPVGGMATAVAGFMRSLGEAVSFAAQSAQRAGSGFTGLKTGMATFTGGAAGAKAAASGLLGVLGGGWSIALTGAAAAAGAWAQAQANAAAAADAFSATLDKQTGALSSASRELAVKSLLKDMAPADWDAVTAASGMTFSAIVTGMMASGQSSSDFHAKWDAFQTDAENGKWGDIVAEQAQSAGNAIAAMTRDMEGGNALNKKSAEGMVVTATATKTAAQAAAEMKTKQDALSSALKAARAAVDQYVQSLIDGNLATLSARDADRALRQSIVDADAALKQNGKTVKNHGAALDLSTAKGRDNASVLDDIALKANNSAKAIYAHTGSEAAMRSSLVLSRASLYATAIRFGLSKSAAKAYVDQVLKVPRTAPTAVGLTGVSSALAAIRDYKVALQGLITTREQAMRSLVGGTSKFAGGGLIRGPGTSTSDSIHARLSDGEYVVKAAAVAKYGPSFLNQVNAMRFASGGLVGQSGSSSTSTNMSRTFNLTMAGGSDAGASARAAMAEIRWQDALTPAVRR